MTNVFTTLNREDCIHFLIPPNLSPALLAATQNVLAPATLPPAPATPSPIKWESVSSSKFDPTSTTPILTLHLPPSSGLPKQVVWHKRGDYLASVCEFSFVFILLSVCSFLTEGEPLPFLRSWNRTRFSLDPSDYETTLASPLPQGQGCHPARPIPSYETPFLRRRESFFFAS